MASITNYPKVISLASTDIVTIHDASSGRTKRTDIVQICKYARDYIQLGQNVKKVDYLQELMAMLSIVDGNLVMTSTDSYASENGLATTSAVQSLITEATDTLASAQDITQLNASLTAYVNGSIVSFTTADAVSQLITKAGVNYSTAADLTTLRTTMEGYTNGQLTSYSTSTAIQQLVTSSTDAVASAQWVTDLEVEMKGYTDEQLTSYSTSTAIQELVTTSTAEVANAEWVTLLQTNLETYADGVVTGYTTTEAVEGLIANSTTDSASTEDFTKLKGAIGTFNEDGTLLTLSSSIAEQVLSTENTAAFAAAESLTKLKSELGTFDEEGNLQTLSTSIAEQVLSTENTAQFAAASEIGTLQAQFTDEDGNTLISRIDENKQVIAGVDGRAEAAYTLEVDNGTGNIAGMKLGSNSEGSEIVFTADSFKISNGTAGESPFEVVNGNVKIKSASIGSITFGDIADVPDTFTTTIIYANNESGANASTTKGTKNYIAFYNRLWVDGDDVSNITFDKISGSDGTSVNILGSVDSESELPATGNSLGDGYLINGVLFVWSGTGWENVGNIQGPAGQNATPKYTWVKYADDENGTAMVDSSSEKAYIGLAFNKDTATESTNPADYAWSKIKGEDGLPGNTANAGANGKKTASGTLFFQTGSQNPPSAPSSSSAVFLFVDGVITGLPSGWGLSTPEMAAGTASNKYWTVSWSAIETTADSNEGAVTFGPVTRSFAFNQVVTFDSLETSGSTVINGDNITTGIIKDPSYLNTSGDGFSDFGMAVDLNNGSIHAEKFYINPDGNANFAGNHGSGTLGGWEINENRIFKDSSTGSISLSSVRNALEIYDEDNNLAVDINNKNSLSSVQGANTLPTGSIWSAGNHTFNLTEPVAKHSAGNIYYQNNERGIKTYSNGQFNFATQANVGEAMQLTANLGNALLISVLIDYPAQWDVNLKARVGMEVYNSDSGALITTVYQDFDETTSYQVNGDSATLRTGNISLVASFNSNTDNYHARFFTQNYYVRFQGDYAQSTVTIEGTFSEYLVIDRQDIGLVQDANKTEIVAGGFQVIKSSSQYFRANRKSQSFLTSSGQWTHHGSLVQTSDKNQKYNIKSIDFDLNLLSNINGYNYSQIINPVHTLAKARAEDICTIESAGLIAQEIEAVLPNAVSTGEDGIKALNYAATTGLLMNIVKQLNEKLNLLELEINNLKK